MSQRTWEVYDERLQFMSGHDAMQLDESLDAGDVSRAWLVWSGAAEVAFSDAFRLVVVLSPPAWFLGEGALCFWLFVLVGIG